MKHSIPYKPGFPYFFTVILTLVSIRLWSFKGIPDGVYDGAEVLVLIILIGLTLHNRSKIQALSTVFKINVNLLIWIPVFSSIGALFFHDQSLFYSAMILRTNFFWLLYFILHIYNIPPKKIINFMILIGVVWAGLTIIQQFTYPIYYFYSRTDSDERTILRAGVYRFMLYRHHFGVFVAFYFFYRYLLYKEMKNLIFVLIALIGFYYFGTRQFGAAVLVCLVIAAFMQKGTAKIYSVTVIILIGIVLAIYSDELFGELIKMTDSEIGSEDNVRLLAGRFYLLEFWPSWLAVLTGNGVEHSLSVYGNEMKRIYENLYFFRSDVGLIGALNKFGIFYVMNLIWLNLKGLNSIYYSHTNKWLKLFFYNALFLLIISEGYSHPSTIPFFCFIFYLVDKSYDSKRIERN